ncbi:MAG: glycosyltransferase family 39 protein [Planctomycetota bacterium]
MKHKKLPQRHKAHRQEEKHQDLLQNNGTQRKLIYFTVVLVLAGLPFALGKYFEFNLPGPFDSGAYVYSAKHILDGAVIGVDERPTAQPGTLLINILGVWLFGFNDTGPKLIQMLLQAAALIVMFYTMRKLYGNLASAIGVIVASVYLSAPLIAKYGNVKEQYMIAFMVLGICCIVLRHLGGRWYLALLAGAFASWGPLFKQTGLSSVGAIGLFVLIQPFLKHRSWRQTCADIGLLVGGAALAICPIYIWLAGTQVELSYYPYWFLFKMLLPTVGERMDSYVTTSRELQGFSEQWPRVLRYYKFLMLPITLAAGAIVFRLVRLVWARLGVIDDEDKIVYNRFVLLFAVWWILDMAFVWISPRSYEQYYLPLNASSAMLAGYLIASYAAKLSDLQSRTKWIMVRLVGLLCMVLMSQHIFFGIRTSPHSGTRYSNPDFQRGYVQRFEEVSGRRQGRLGSWEMIGRYIRQHSKPDDKIYVWGWVPGIYVQAQRLSSAPSAFESEMHTSPPEDLKERIDMLLKAFEKEPPKYMVDTHKRHFPWKIFPFELWPSFFPFDQQVKSKLTDKQGFLRQAPEVVELYDRLFTELIRTEISEQEVRRYEVMLPLRRYVMNNYRHLGAIGENVLFELKDNR